jgi:hypothetical protein
VAKGTAFAPDVITALSFDPHDGWLDIGTMGGVFRWRAAPGLPLHLDPEDSNVRFTFNRGEQLPENWVTQVNRFRRDSQGKLWVRFGSSGSMIAGLGPDLKWMKVAGTAWPVGCLGSAGWTVNLEGSGFTAPGGVESTVHRIHLSSAPAGSRRSKISL